MGTHMQVYIVAGFLIPRSAWKIGRTLEQQMCCEKPLTKDNLGTARRRNRLHEEVSVTVCRWCGKEVHTVETKDLFREFSEFSFAVDPCSQSETQRTVYGQQVAHTLPDEMAFGPNGEAHDMLLLVPDVSKREESIRSSLLSRAEPYPEFRAYLTHAVFGLYVVPEWA